MSISEILAYLTAPTKFEIVHPVPVQLRGRLRDKIAPLLPIVFEGKGSDDEVDAAIRLLTRLGAQRRWRLWILSANPKIHPRVWSVILAEIWSDGKGGLALRQAGFGYCDVAQMFERAIPEHLMSAEDYAVYRDLPTRVTVYRGTAGVSIKTARRGMSWTLERKEAEWFARHHGQGEPLVIEALAPKEQILAYLSDREEAEIIVRPGHVVGARQIAAQTA